jgi:hypothetical protein
MSVLFIYIEREREVKERSSLVTPIDLSESVLGGKDGSCRFALVEPDLYGGCTPQRGATFWQDEEDIPRG